ncbi:trypco2 family protein [Vibrio sp. M260121]|uniref:trypco2 family protein n=1 Tax=Vibrio sp. M260121 TaxID=3020897 RepID=UPI002F40EDBC
MADRPLFIKELVRQVHNELYESQEERELQGQDALFEVEKLTIEANFIVTDSETESGGIDFKLLKYNAGGSSKNERVHKVILELVTPSKPSSNVPRSDDKSSGGGTGGGFLTPRKGLNPAPIR